MFHQPLCRTQYGNCKAWRFAIIKHIFNDVTPDWKRSAGQPGWTCPCVCFVRPQLINSEGFSPRLDKPIKFMSPVFFFLQERKEVDLVCSPSRNGHFILPSPGAFSTREQTVPGAPGAIRLSPPCTIVSRVDQSLPGFNKSSICYVLCHIFISKIKQMLRLYNPNCRATQGWKRDGHSVASEGEKKSFGHIFRGIKHLGAINRLQPALFQPLCCLWIINVNRDRFVYFECGTTGAEWQDE